MCAPDCVQGVDGRFYIYYQLHMLTCTSVAVADNPAGPFEFYGYVQHADGTPWGEKKGDSFAFDPGILVDDGKAYCYVGFAPEGWLKDIFESQGIKVASSICLSLDADMKTVIGDEKIIAPGPELSKGTAFEGHAFYEASSIRKIKDTYYYVYSSELSHELCYATSKYPDRDFQYGGTLVSIGDIGYEGNTIATNYLGNTHGGMTEINGEWYIFYHRQTNKQKCARQGCAEKIHILEDGSISQVEITSCGLNGEPLSGNGSYEARIACNLSSAEGTFPYLESFEKDEKGIHPYFTQSDPDRESQGDQYIANMTNGSFAGFKYFLFDGKERGISITARGQANGKMKVYTDRANEAVAEIDVYTSEKWKEFRGELSAVTDIQPLYFEYEGEGYLDFLSFEIHN